jgi:hypothetical protein
VKFTIEAEGFAGETFEMLDPDDYLWAEAAALEKVTGHSIGDIEDRKTGLYRTADVNAGRLWLSVKRTRPATTFREIQQLPIRAQKFQEQPPDPDDVGETAVAPDPPEPDDASPGPPSSTSESGT